MLEIKKYNNWNYIKLNQIRLSHESSIRKSRYEYTTMKDLKTIKGSISKGKSE